MAVVPLLPDRSGAIWCRNSLALPVNTHVKRSSPLWGDDPVPVLDALLPHLQRTHAEQPLRLGLKHLRSDSRLIAALAAVAARHQLAVTIEEVLPSPTIGLDGDWDHYLAGRSRHVRSELKRKQRQAAQAGLQVVTISKADDVDRALDDILRIEQGSWKEAEGTSFGREIGAAGFYRTLARQCAAAGWLRLYLMYHHERPVAHLYGVVHKNEYYAIKTSYDESYRQLSPGAVLFAHVIRDACAQGLTTIDLLGAAARWKNELATASRGQVDVCVVSTRLVRCSACRLHRAHVRPLLQRHVKPLLEQHAPRLLTASQRVGALIGHLRAPARG